MPSGAPAGQRPVPTPVFIHGSGGDHRVWGHQTACFAGGAYLDLPGHPGGLAVADADELAGAVAGALDEAGRPGVLVGHSLGGALALRVATTRPDLVEGLVIIASGARLPVPAPVMAAPTTDFHAECARLMHGFFVDPAAVDLPVEQVLTECGPQTLAADYAACASIDLRGALDRVRVPVMIICGADDRLTPPWLSRELAGELAGARVVEIEGARHMPMVEAPATVNLLIGAFLADVEMMA